jgi:DNA-binding FadR family transcriptional regulator
MATAIQEIENRESGATAVISGIIEYLKERRLQPGDRLPSERDLAERLGVGRNAVREALAKLVTLRMVESRSNSGIYLRHVERESSFEALVMLTDMGSSPTPTDISETLEVRAHLEALAARLACQRRDEIDLLRLNQILSDSQALLAKGGNIVDMDTEFHMALVTASHNSVLVRVLNAFYRFTAKRRTVHFADLKQAEVSLKDHRKLVDFIRQQDEEKSVALARKHMNRAATYWSTLFADSPKSTRAAKKSTRTTHR